MDEVNIPISIDLYPMLSLLKRAWERCSRQN